MKNELSVWTYPYRKTYYLTHPWMWFKDTYWNFRNWWHRGKYGFGYVDAWNWSNWWCEVGAAALKYMAENGHGYPGVEPWETPEKWKEHLLKTVEELKWCAKTCDWDGEEENEFSDAFHKIMSKAWHETRDERGYIIGFDLTMDEKELKDKYWVRVKEITKEHEVKRQEILGRLGKELPRYWD